MCSVKVKFAVSYTASIAKIIGVFKSDTESKLDDKFEVNARSVND
jgi:hypothetical protein